MTDDPSIPMTVAELIAHLRTFPPETRCLYQAYSDWNALTADQIVLDQAIDKGSAEYFMRVYERQIPSLTDKERAAIRTYVTFPGN